MHLVVDVVGWYPRAGTRRDDPDPRPRHAQGWARRQGASRRAAASTWRSPGAGIVPSTGVDAVLLDVTAARPARGLAHRVARPGRPGRRRPSCARLSSGTSITGLVVAEVGTNGRVSIQSTAATDVVVDVVGLVSRPAVTTRGSPRPACSTPATGSARPRAGSRPASTVSVPGPRPRRRADRRRGRGVDHADTHRPDGDDGRHGLRLGARPDRAPPTSPWPRAARGSTPSWSPSASTGRSRCTRAPRPTSSSTSRATSTR